MGIIAWCDIETVGVDPSRSPILEVAFIFTSDKKLTEISRYHSLIKPRDLDKTLARIEADDWAKVQHRENGLYDELAAGGGKPKEQVISEVLEQMARANPLRGKVPLGGSGVERFESHFFRIQMAALSEALHFWAYDIGSVRRIAALAGIRPPADVLVNESGSHRAMADVEQHIAEFRWFKQFLAEAKDDGALERMAEGEDL